jgi:hypothetical protein
MIKAASKPIVTRELLLNMLSTPDDYFQGSSFRQLRLDGITVGQLAHCCSGGSHQLGRARSSSSTQQLLQCCHSSRLTERLADLVIGSNLWSSSSSSIGTLGSASIS